MSEPHTFRYERVEGAPEGTALYRLHGILGDSEHSFELLEDVRAAVKAGARRIVINMEDCEYMTSAGVGVMAGSYTSSRNAEAEFVLSSVRPKVSELLDLTGLQSLVPIYETEREALARSG